ncbi:MAG: hypothetical protein KDN19_01420 [Verrucomicrobiae bacterium]|nr:hypothetical protein [Verrucomicrobiae bacterium]
MGIWFAVGGARVEAQLPNSKELAASNPAAAYNLILMSLGQQKYIEGLELVDEVIRYWGPRAAEQYGPGFGHFYYLKGLLQMGLEDYAGAVVSFRTCREDFSNEIINNEGERESTKLQNRFLTHALAQWGACLMVLGDYAGAVEKLKAALAESAGVKIRTDVIGLNLARSHLRNGDFDDGLALLEKAMRSESLAIEMKRKAFLILAEDWSPEVSFDRVQPYLWEFGDLVRQDTRGNRWSRNPLFAYLGRQALDREDPLRALTWYSFLLDPRELVNHRRELLAEMELNPPTKPEEEAAWKSRIEETRKGIDEAESMVAAMLLGVGAGHYQMRNYAGAYAAFREVADAFPKHEKRPDTLYNVVASGVQLAMWQQAQKDGKQFLDEYPDHPLAPEVARLLAESTFILQEWQQAYEIAIDLRDRFEIGSVGRDVPDFVVGASLYHLDRYEEADAELTAYLKNYPDARRLEAATYYHGSCKVKRFQWKEGVEILEAFMEKWPGSDLLSSALYQSALGRFVLGDLEEALARIDRLQSEFPDAMEIPASWNLKGDVLTSLGTAEFEEIETPYRTAIELGDGVPVHFDTVAYSYWKLILMHAQAGKDEAAVALYDAYRKGYDGSRHELDIVAAVVDSLVEVGRSSEAEDTLRRQIRAYAGEAESGSLGELMGTFLKFLDTHYTPDEVENRIQYFPLPTPAPVPLRAWLTMIRIERAEKGKGSDASRAATLSAGYRELASLGDKREMPNYPLVKLARWYRDDGKANEAREIYEFLLEHRAQGPHVEMAMFDLAGMLSQTGVEEDGERAVTLYRQVREQSDASDLQEASVIGGGRLLFEEGDFEEAKVWWTDYLRHSNWQSARAEANFRYGTCIEKTGSPNEALKIYASVYALYPGHLNWSTESYLGAARILKTEGRDGDAILVLVDMLKRLGHLEHPGIEKGRKLFAEWKEEWVKKS